MQIQSKFGYFICLYEYVGLQSGSWERLRNLFLAQKNGNDGKKYFNFSIEGGFGDFDRDDILGLEDKN